MSIQPLINVLDQLIALHEELLKCAEEKTPVLVKNEVTTLNDIVHKESKMVKHMEELERKRVQSIGEYLISRGYNPDPRVTVGDLIRIIFKADEKKLLQVRQQALLKIVKKLQSVNELNAQLIKQSLHFIDYSIDLIVGAPEDDAMYQNPNQQRYGQRRQGVFDSRA